MWQKYVGRPLAVVYVFLGSADGGLGRRRESRAFVMSPAQAWDLPRRCGRSFAAESPTYRFGRMPAALLEYLEPYAVTDEQWHERLPGVATADH